VDENFSSTSGPGQFTMDPDHVVQASHSYAAEADALPGKLTGALDAAMTMLTANPGFASSTALQGILQGDVAKAVGGVSAETDYGSRALRTLAAMTVEANDNSSADVDNRLGAPVEAVEARMPLFRGVA
jgi:hypothetical protein